MDLISIVIPAYNAGRTIKKCLESICAQTYKNIEVIVINDGSSDDTEKNIRESMSEDDRIQVYSQENKGVSAARNNGISHVKGKYIAFVDADDYMEPNMYETMVRVVQESEDTDIVICNYYVDDGQECRAAATKSQSWLTSAEAMTNLFIESSYCAYLWSKLFKVELIKKNGILFCEDLDVCEDSVFCCEYFSKIRKGRYINQELYYYRVFSDSAVHKKYNMKRYTALKACDKVIGIIRLINNEKLDKAVNAFCSVICVQLMIMTSRKRSEENIMMYKHILERMKKCKWNFLMSEWGIKYKLVFTIFKGMSYFTINKKENQK